MVGSLHQRVLAVLAAVLLASCTSQDASLAIRSANIVDIETGEIRSGQTVIVVGDHIEAIGPDGDVEVPGSAVVIDAEEGFLIPGLWDMHVHASRNGRAPRFWPTLVAHGVTGFREMGSHVDSLLHWRAEAARPERRAPRVYWGAMVDGVPPVYEMSVLVTDAEAAIAVVDSLADLGLDFIKVYDRIGREAYFALAARARERGIPFVGHVPTSVTAVEAVEGGQMSLEHGTDVHVACTPGTPALPPSLVRKNAPSSAEEGAAVQALFNQIVRTAPTAEACMDLLDRMRTAGTWLTPTLTLGHSITRSRSFGGSARLQRVPASVRAEWEESRLPAAVQNAIGPSLWRHAMAAVRIPHEAGVPILAGTDASDMAYIFVGSGLHDELVYLVEAGLTPLDALRAATLNPARFMGREHAFGTVEVGKAADLVLLAANPLDDIANVRRIRAVVLRGEYLNRATLDTMAAMEWVGVE